MARRTTRALIVDDGSGARISLQASLQALGLVAEVADGSRPTDLLQQCCAAMDNAELKYAFVFVGIHWALSRGQEFASEMRGRRQTCNVPAVIGMIARDQPAIAKLCLDMGMADVITEPFPLDALYESVCSMPNVHPPEMRQRAGSAWSPFPGFDDLVEIHDGLILMHEPSQPEHSEAILESRLCRSQKEGDSSPFRPSASQSLCIAQKPASKASIDIFSHPPLASEEEVVLSDTWALPANRNHCVA
jgi:CheY-like chemotaxis protein